MVQVLYAATEGAHVFVCPKSPVVATLEIARLLARLLLRVTTIGPLVVPIGVLPKLRLAGDSLTGTTPVPVKATV